MAFIYNLSDTWNDAGVTFTGIGLNVTDSASASASNLLNLQVGGVSRFSVGKGGDITLPQVATGVFPNDYANAGIKMPGGAGIYGYAGGFGFFTGNGQKAIFASPNWSGVNLLNGFSLGFRADGLTSAADLVIARDAANTLALRNGTNAQALRLYGTFTDASNYQRLSFSQTAFQATITTEWAGTGGSFGIAMANLDSLASRQSRFRFTADAAVIGNTPQRLSWVASSQASSDAAGDVHLARQGSGLLALRGGVGATSGAALNFLEQTAPAAPATNEVYIYAEDNGSGKTRLMARFATGAAVQIAIEP